MYNDFVLVGPKSDAAKIAGGKDILSAYKKIADAKAPFASRGDSSAGASIGYSARAARCVAMNDLFL